MALLRLRDILTLAYVSCLSSRPFPMPPRLRLLINRLKAAGRRVQALALRVLLVLLYLVGFGITRLYMTLFRRDLLGFVERGGGAAGASLWLPAKGYGLAPEERRSQS